MDDAGLVRGLERFRDLPRDRQRFVERHRPARETLREVVALDQLHDQSGRVSRLFEAVDLRDARVVQRRERLGLPLETHQPIGVGRERLGQDLERDVAIEPGIAPAIDLPHPPGPKRGDHFIRADSGAGTQAHRRHHGMGGSNLAIDAAGAACG